MVCQEKEVVGTRAGAGTKVVWLSLAKAKAEPARRESRLEVSGRESPGIQGFSWEMESASIPHPRQPPGNMQPSYKSA